MRCMPLYSPFANRQPIGNAYSMWLRLHARFCRFCSGQSNMWLVMHFDTSRNITYDKVMAGKYKNIRMHTTPVGMLAGHSKRLHNKLSTGRVLVPLVTCQ